MRTAGFCPPLIVTRPTPLNCENIRREPSVYKEPTWESGMESDVMPNVSTGASAGLCCKWAAQAAPRAENFATH